MKKGILVLVMAVSVMITGGAMVAGMAAPAMAEMSMTGFVRSLAVTSNYERYAGTEFFPIKYSESFASTATSPFNGFFTPSTGGPLTFGNSGEFTLVVPAPTQAAALFVNTKAGQGSYLETRARIRFEAKEEKVGAVFFFEIDGRWGDSQYVSGRRNGGFGLEADTINLETKNVYVWFKPVSNMTFNVGLLNYTDYYAGVLFGGADIAGIVGEAKFEPVDLRFGYGKIKDSTNITVSSSTGAPPGQTALTNGKNQDVDLWFIEAHMSPNKDSRIGLNLHYVNDRGFQQPTSAFSYTINPTNGINTVTESALGYDSAKIYTLGLDGSWAINKMFNLSGFAFMQFGDVTNPCYGPGDCYDGKAKAKGYSVDLRLDVTGAGPGKLFIEGLRVSGQKEDQDDLNGIWNGSNYANAGALFTRTDMEILLPGALDSNTSQALVYDPKGPSALNSGTGLGILHFAAGYTMPVAPKLMAKIGLGWAQSAEKWTGTGYQTDKNLGTELNGKLTYNVAKGLDLQGVAAYLWLGDFYNPGSNEAGVEKGDNLYKLYARLNYAF